MLNKSKKVLLLIGLITSQTLFGGNSHSSKSPKKTAKSYKRSLFDSGNCSGECSVSNNIKEQLSQVAPNCDILFGAYGDSDDIKEQLSEAVSSNNCEESKHNLLVIKESNFIKVDDMFELKNVGRPMHSDIYDVSIDYAAQKIVIGSQYLNVNEQLPFELKEFCQKVCKIRCECEHDCFLIEIVNAGNKVLKKERQNKKSWSKQQKKTIKQLISVMAVADLWYIGEFTIVGKNPQKTYETNYHEDRINRRAIEIADSHDLYTIFPDQF